MRTVSSDISPFIFKSAKKICNSNEHREHQQNHCWKSQLAKSKLHLLKQNNFIFGVINVIRRGGSALMNCFCLLFRPETRFLKSFTANILSQFRALHFTRSDRGQGGAHYHHIQPVKSPQTDFTQNLPLVKWYISTPLAF